MFYQFFVFIMCLVQNNLYNAQVILLRKNKQHNTIHQFNFRVKQKIINV